MPCSAHEKRLEDAAEVLHKGYLLNHRRWHFCREREEQNLTLEDFKSYLAAANVANVKDNNQVPKSYGCSHFIDRLRRPYSTRYLLKISLIGTLLFTSQGACLFGVLLYARIVRDYVYLVALINNLTGIPGAALSAILYAKIRRRKLPLVVTYISAALCMAFGGIYASINKASDDIVLSICSNLGLVLCTASCNMILTYIPELFPTRIRSQGLGNAAGLGRFGATLGNLINSLDTRLGHGTPLLVYAGLLITASFALLLLPDTTGEELEDKIGDDNGDRMYKP